jgi:hypothetical protein
MILPVVSYVYDNLFIARTEEEKLSVYENRVLGRTYGPMAEDGTDECRTQDDGEGEMGRTCIGWER